MWLWSALRGSRRGECFFWELWEVMFDITKNGGISIRGVFKPREEASCIWEGRVCLDGVEEACFCEERLIQVFKARMLA